MGACSGRHKAAIAYSIVSSDDKKLYTVGWDGLAICWDLTNYSFIY